MKGGTLQPLDHGRVFFCISWAGARVWVGVAQVWFEGSRMQSVESSQDQQRLGSEGPETFEGDSQDQPK